MEDTTPTSKGVSSRRERLKRYIVYALILITSAILVYIFVWFGAQLGLQN